MYHAYMCITFWLLPGICGGEQGSELESGGDSGNILRKEIFQGQNEKFQHVHEHYII